MEQRQSISGGKTIDPLPSRIRALRQSSFSLLVSSLPKRISKPELEAMFCRVGRVVDSFIPIDMASGKTRGFVFVRFRFEAEARRAIELTTGRSWGVKIICVQLARS